KIPYDPQTGLMAKANDPATWADATTAGAHFVTASPPGVLGGIGLQLTKIAHELQLCGVDLDGCIPKPDAPIAPWAQDIIDEFKSYAEVSPSGTGVKIYFFFPTNRLAWMRVEMGTSWSRLWQRAKPADGSKTPGIELHLGNRYFAFTANRVITSPETINL